MKFAIVDDMESSREMLRSYLAQYCRETGLTADIALFSSGTEFLRQYKLVYDLILFDIDMPGLNGMDTARRIREADSRVTIMFVTNLAQYAINGYEVGAVDYILKPVTYPDFSMKMKRALRRVAQQMDHTVAISTSTGQQTVSVSEVRYVEVLSHTVIYHLRSGVITARGTMRDAQALLEPYPFCRIHKSYLVNLSFVESVSGREVTLRGEALPVGRVYRDGLLQSYMNYVKG